MLSVGGLIAIINLLSAIAIVLILFRFMTHLRGSKLYFATGFLVLQSMTFVVHALTEVLNFDEIYYAISALVASIALFFAIYFANQSIRELGGAIE